jgi:hypothetical protein
MPSPRWRGADACPEEAARAGPQAALEVVAASPNKRPRATHVFDCRAEVFAAMLEAAHRASTSVH